MKNRVETLRNYVDNMMKNKVQGEFWVVERHMFAVSNFSAMIALKRNLNQEIVTMIGLLHDIHTLLTDDPANHAALGSLKAERILTELNIVNYEELENICTAIKNHSSKGIIHDAYSELIKDADVLSHYFYNTSLPITESEKKRLEGLLLEFGLNQDLI